MDKKTLKITTGAAVIAVFTIMLFLNRQTGGFFEEIFLFLFPIPMLAFSVQYGWKNSLPVLFAMAFFSVLFGTLNTIFYAVSEALIGLVFGDCLYRKVDGTKTLFLVMVLSAIANVLNTIVLAGVFGVDLKTEIQEMQTMMNDIFTGAGVAVPENLLSDQFLMQLMVIAMVLLGILQGFVIYQLSLQILRRLRFQVQSPKSLFLFFPPKWTGWLAAVSYVGYTYAVIQPFADEFLQNTLQAAGMCGNLYLMVFGIIALLLYNRVSLKKPAAVGILLCVLAYMVFPFLLLFGGLFYITTDFHKNLLKM